MGMSNWASQIKNDLEKVQDERQQINGVDFVDGENPELTEQEKNFVEKPVTEGRQILNE